MNSEGDYSIACTMDSHHGYPSAGTYSPGTLDIYSGFHQQHQHHHTSLGGNRSPMDPAQHASYYGNGDASLSPQLGTPGELPPLPSGGTHHHHHSPHQGVLSGYASGSASSIHTTRGNNNSNNSSSGSSNSSSRNQQSGYPHAIPAAHTHHNQQHQHHHQNNSQQQHHHNQHHQQQIHTVVATTDGISNASNNNNSLHYTAASQMPHDLAMTAHDLYHSSNSPHHHLQQHHPHHHHLNQQHPHQHHHNMSTTPNFLEIGAAGSHIGMRTPPGYHHHHHGSSGPAGSAAAAIVDQKFSLQAQLSGHSVVPGPLTNGYLPPPTSSPLKSEGGNSQPGLQGKPFRWMTIKRTPAKPVIIDPTFSPSHLGRNSIVLTVIGSRQCPIVCDQSSYLYPPWPLFKHPAMLATVWRARNPQTNSDRLTLLRPS
ncbi:hypothetical protein EGW08_008751 [Elysia chlorotica]|uniref:Uncharacterized protein n=1 Tax=Elysia chlorotica TaxID=188477 RepID=A0A433TPP8_ELYCH|nr:hypothetical protein EGW08_008751 [Elysia chlorotica]